MGIAICVACCAAWGVHWAANNSTEPFLTSSERKVQGCTRTGKSQLKTDAEMYLNNGGVIVPINSTSTVYEYACGGGRVVWSEHFQ